VKVQVAAWLKIGRSSGTEYLSLKVANNDRTTLRPTLSAFLRALVSTGGGRPHAVLWFHRGSREDRRR